MKVYKLVEQFNKDPENYSSLWRKLLGYTAPNKIDKEQREINPYDVSLQEVAYEFLGRDYMTEMTRIQEAGNGGTVLPSHFKNISAFSDTVSGLLGAMVLDAYESPQFIGTMLVANKESNVQGGRIVGAANDGEPAPTGQNLLPGESYPNVGLRETWVNVPDFKRRGNAIELNRDVFKYDLTGMIAERAQASGFAIAREKEIEIADLVMGVTNTYSRDTNNKTLVNNTYQAAAGANPYNYVNMENRELLDWNSIDAARVLLGQNTDPSTGYEINIAVDNMILLVAPGRAARTSTIVNAIQVRTDSTVDQNSTRLSENPIARFPILSSQIWYNRLIAAGLTETQATERWYLLNGPRAFEYHSAWPLSTASTNISSEQVKRDVVVSLVTSEVGTAVVKEPRHAYRGNDVP